MEIITKPQMDAVQAWNVNSKYDSPRSLWIDTNDLYDEGDGDVQAPTGWFGRYDREIILEDNYGFVTSVEYDDKAGAEFAFQELSVAFGLWLDDDTDGW